jgi:hypothetical protein
MLPIVRFPRIVEQQMSWFESVFTTDEQRKHFREYVTGLIAGNEATVTAINNLFLDRNDQSALNKFLTQAKWDESELNRRRVQMELARLHRRPVSAKAGRLVLDDTLAHHTRCSIEWLAYLWDHAEQRYVWAHDVVTSYYVNRTDQFPVDFRLWYQFQAKKERKRLCQAAQALATQPTLDSYRQRLLDLLVFSLRQQLYHTKTTLGADLVRSAAAMNLPFSVVVFDSWFLHNDLIDHIEAEHKDWVGGCPRNRLVLVNNRWIQLKKFWKTLPPAAYRPTQIHDRRYWVFTKVLPMKSLRRRRVRFNEDTKGHLGFEDYQLHKLRGIRRHWYLCFVAYSLLGNQGHPGRSRQGVRAPFESTGQRCRAVAHELLGYLVHWVAQQLEEDIPAATITQTLLA